jgi:tRNA-splicing ligase RtcB
MPDRSLPENIVSWLAEPLPSECLLALRRLASAQDVLHVAVMPDVHLVEEVCNGVAVATSDLIYPQAVGGDIGCGILAVAADSSAEPFDDERIARRILSQLNECIPSNRHSATMAAAQLPDDLRVEPLSELRLTKLAQRDGRVQLGTLGRGNHFVELQRDTDDRLWVMIHAGSRGIGQAISHWHLEQAQKGARSRLPSLSASSDAGQRFLHDMEWARKYASANRRAMLQAVERTLQQVLGCGLNNSTFVETDHDHVVRETHWDREVWVHRKGAQPAAVDQPGLIPGSMGTRSYLVRGRGCATSLCSSSHGAGRALPRTIARQQIGQRQLLREMSNTWFDDQLAEHLRDEAPSAYKDVQSVMRAQRELTAIVTELRPVLVYKR